MVAHDAIVGRRRRSDHRHLSEHRIVPNGPDSIIECALVEYGVVPHGTEVFGTVTKLGRSSNGGTGVIVTLTVELRTGPQDSFVVGKMPRGSPVVECDRALQVNAQVNSKVAITCQGVCHMGIGHHDHHSRSRAHAAHYVGSITGARDIPRIDVMGRTGKPVSRSRPGIIDCRIEIQSISHLNTPKQS